jgi:hypothetical protein
VTLVARRGFSGRSNVASSEFSKSIAVNYLAQRIHRTEEGYTWFKMFKAFKPFKTSEKTERSG